MSFRLLVVSSLTVWAAASPCYPGASCFPSLSILSAFNASIGGKLHTQRPIGASCYVSDPLYNPALCSSIIGNYTNDQWRSDSFSSYEQIEWETCGVSDSCLLPAPSNVSASCGQGSVPSYAVHATSTSDIQKYVTFATLHNLPIVVKNTGHDYSGRSSLKGGFALWTHGIQGMARKEKFVPKGCKIAPQDSVTFTAGVQWGPAYDWAASQNITVVGGQDSGVGACGGWTLGGGHSTLSPSYGLGVDNILEAQIVTANGDLLTISECSNPDLFWAIRGGGPSFGILSEITYKAHPGGPVHVVFISPSSTTTDENFEAVARIASISPHLNSIGIGGVAEVFATDLTFFALYPGSNASVLREALLPITSSLPTEAVNYTTFPDFNSFETLITTGQYRSYVGLPIATSSRLIPSHYMETNATAVAQAIRNGQIAAGPSGSFVQVLLTSPPPSLNHGLTSCTPAWYSSAWHVAYAGAWATNTSTTGQKGLIESLHNAAGVLRAFAPDSGAYSNEADIFEPNHLQSFWGSNANRLLEVKRKYDPGNVFEVWQGIGWAGASNPKFACYSNLNPNSTYLG